MPTISIFIRAEDLEKWRNLEHKSEWLHQQLNAPSVQTLITKDIQGIKVSDYVGNGNFEEPEIRCKNGHPIPEGRDRCMGKGCKYS